MSWTGPLIVSYTDINAIAALTGNYDFPKAIKGLNGNKENVIEGCRIKVIQPFAGGAIATLTASVGSVATPTSAITAQNVMAAANTVYAAVPIASDAQNTQIRVAFTATGANLTALTAGRIAIWFDYESMPAAN